MSDLKDGSLNLEAKEGNEVFLKLYKSFETGTGSLSSEETITDDIIEAAVENGSFYSEDYGNLSPLPVPIIVQDVSFDGENFLNESTGELISLRSKSVSFNGKYLISLC